MATHAADHSVSTNDTIKDSANDSTSDRQEFDQEYEHFDIEDKCKYEKDPQERLLITYNENDPMVSVDVRPARDSTRFPMFRKQLATSSSEFIKEKVESGWFEKNKSIELPQHTEATFLLYTDWLSHVQSLSHMANEANPCRAESHAAQFRQLASAFVLGEDLVDNEFKNFIIDS